MADLSPTAANVDLISGPTGLADCGEAITAGEPVYVGGSDGKLYKCIATSLAAAACVGVALNTTDAADQPVRYAMPGAIVDLGAGTAGMAYYVSGATAGDLSPSSDATTPASTEFGTIVTLARANNYHLVICAQTRSATA